MLSSFEDLEVFKRAYVLSLEIHKRSIEFLKVEQYGLGDQIRKASKSICANLAEGFAKQRYSSQEFKRYVMIAVGSSDEMRVWTILSRSGILRRRGLAPFTGWISRNLENAGRFIQELEVAVFFLTSVPCLLTWLVGEHCGGLRRRTVRSVGDPTSAYVDTSSEKQGEKPCRRKPQVSCSQVNLLRVSRPLRRGRKA
jgi:four helix bundle protein